MNPALRHDAEQRRAVEREAVAAPTAAARAEDSARLRQVERELGLGLARQCLVCRQWVSLQNWPDEGALCGACSE
jgi:hypothetical protein